jgi:hypothetical protein
MNHQERKGVIINEVHKSVWSEMALAWTTIFLLATMYITLYSLKAFLGIGGTALCFFAVINIFATFSAIASATQINFKHLNSRISMVKHCILICIKISIFLQQDQNSKLPNLPDLRMLHALLCAIQEETNQIYQLPLFLTTSFIIYDSIYGGYIVAICYLALLKSWDTSFVSHVVSNILWIVGANCVIARYIWQCEKASKEVFKRV